jgi:predicted glycogen debranching enzyme
MGFISPIDFGRDICGRLETSEQREWLVTNGIGGFASGTIAGVLTRRYHGLLVAALKPPAGRTLLVSKIDEVVNYNGKTFSLGANRWWGGAIDPRGFELIDRFRLHGTTPVWTFDCDVALIEKQVCMEQGANTTYVTYKIVRASHTLRLALKVLVNFRDFHGSTHAGDWCMDVQRVEHGLRVVAFEGAQPFYLLSPLAAAEPAHIWYRNYDLAVERFRGLDDHEDHLHAATFSAELKAGESVSLAFSTEPAPNLDASEVFERRSNHERSLIDLWNRTQPPAAEKTPLWVQQLVLAARPRKSPGAHHHCRLSLVL